MTYKTILEQLLAQFHMVCVLFSNICTLLHSKIHTAWVTTLSFRWIKLFFLPFLSVFFTQVSETISFWLRSRQPTGNCTSWGAKEKKKKKVSGRFLFCSASMEHNMLVKNLTVLFWHLTPCSLFNLVQTCLILAN